MLEEYWINERWIDRSTLVLSDARLVRYAACVYDGWSEAAECGVSKEDLVPFYLDNVGFERARDVALALGWIISNPAAPSGKEARYFGSGLSPDACFEHDALELHHDEELRRFAEFHHDTVQEMMMSMPGKCFTSEQLCRKGGGPCTQFTWSVIRDLLNDDDDIEKIGHGRGRKYVYNGLSDFNSTVARRAVRRPWGELAPDYFLSDFMIGEDNQGKGVA